MSALVAGLAAHAQQPSQFVQDELLVGLRAGVGPAARFKLFRELGLTYIEDVVRHGRVVRVSVAAQQADAAIRRLNRRPQVRFAEKNLVFDPALAPNDPQFAGQWHLPHIQAPRAWDVTQGGAGAVIAVLDSGIDATHPDLAARLVAGYNTYSGNTSTVDQYGHGTEVAGAVAASTNNGKGVAGVAGASPIMPVRVTDAKGRATTASIATGITWAADHGARIINLSFNGVAGNLTIRNAAADAFNRGALVVAASGNCGCADPTEENPYVLSVSATDESDAVANFSSTGPYVDLSAPGTNILTTAKGGLYIADSGTSLASPLVAGVAALMFTARPTLTPALVMQLLEASALNPSGSYDESHGYGLVNAYDAVAAAMGYTPPPDTTPPTVTLTSPDDKSTVSGTVVVGATATDDVGVVKVDLYLAGMLFATDTDLSPSFAWDTTAFANGSYTLQLVASDAAGNATSTVPISVTVSNAPPDTTAPVVSIASPANGAALSGTVAIAVNATDDVGVTKVDFFIDGVLVVSDTAAPYAYNWDTATATGGAHALLATASDAAGNTASASRSVSVANARPPVAVNDAFSAPARSGNSYTAQVYTVLSNDSAGSASINTGSVAIVSAPNKGGSVTVKTNGSLTYKPNKGFVGVETFTYNVKDSLGSTSNAATVSVSVQ